MKSSRLNKVLGLALGERSLLAAEVVNAPGGPEVRRAAEFHYPDGVSTKDPAALGAALGTFLRDGQFSARAAVVGLPARWLVVKSKDVPPADPATLADLLRLQAEGEFSSELKDLVYDYAADATAGHPRSVLLMATPKRYVDAAVALCGAAKLDAAGVTASAVALGAATGRGADRSEALVLNVGPGGTELTAQAGRVPSAIRHLRGPSAQASPEPGGEPVPSGVDRPFIGELRRTVSALPVATGTGRQLILWGTDSAAMNPAALGDGLGLPVRPGELSTLGVKANGGAANGDGRTYAVAVALALSALGPNRQAVDFLHPRLAAPKQRLVPRWVVLASLGTVIALGGVYYAWQDMGKRQATLDALKASNKNRQPLQTAAQEFVTKVTFAQAWQGGNPRYLDCYRDLTRALMPLDDGGLMYGRSLTIGETLKPLAGGTGAKAAEGPTTLTGSMSGFAPDQRRVQDAVRRLKETPAFADVQLTHSVEGVSGSAGHERQVSYTIAFIYAPHAPAAALPASATTPQPPDAHPIATQPTTVPLR